MARFPDSRINTTRLSSQPLLPTDFAAGSTPSDSANATLLAYSGGTVWASHPLPMAAEVYVGLSNVWLAPGDRSITER